MVLAEPAAGAGFAKLTDLGVAHVASADELTATGDVVGTLAYMAPEQAEGQRITAACDVYSLALTLYEAWTGTNPVRARGAAATARRLGMALPPLRSMRPDLPADLAEVVDAALDPDPQYRPDPAELAEVLDEAADDLSDEGGLVEPETIERFGLTAVRARTRLMTHAAPRRHGGGARAGGALGAEPPRGAGRPGGCRPGRRRAGRWRASPPWAPRRRSRPLAAAAAVALAVGVLPRLGWLAAPRRRSACGWPPPAASRGSALVLRAGPVRHARCCCPGPGRCGRCPRSRPLLGLAGVAPMFVGLAALAGTALAAGGAGRRRLPVAGGGRGAERPRPAVRRGRRHARAGALGGLGARRGPERRRGAAADVAPRWRPAAGVGRLRGGAAADGAGSLGGRRPAAGRGLGGGPGGGARLARASSMSTAAGPPDRARRRGGRRPRRPGGRHGHPARRVHAIGPTCPRSQHYPDHPPMSVLKNLEAKLGGLVEGAFSRAFKSRVEPVELARKLAREMEESKQVSVSRVYVPNHYRVFLSPQDREQFESYEPALRKELSDYLLEHARAERLALTSRPAVEFMTDDRLGLGEFGIQAQLLGEPEPEPGEALAEAAPVAGRLRPHDGLLARPRRAQARAARAGGALAGRALRRRAAHGAERRARGHRPQPRLRDHGRRRQRVAPPRRAAARRATPGWWPTWARPTASRSTVSGSTRPCCATATWSPWA